MAQCIAHSTVTHPKPSTIGGNVALVQSGAASYSESLKVASYSKDFLLTPAFIPFGLETTGAWGPSAVSFTKLIAEAKYGVENKGLVSKFIRDLSLRVSVALQKEVAHHLIDFQAAIDKARVSMALGMV